MHNLCCGRKEDYDFEYESGELNGLDAFSYVGKGVMQELQAKAPHRHTENWNVNFGKVSPRPGSKVPIT